MSRIQEFFIYLARLTGIRNDLKLLCRDVLPLIKQDLANIWTKRVKRDFEKIDDEAIALNFLLGHLHRYYERLGRPQSAYAERTEYSKELSDIRGLRKHIRKAKPKSKSIKKIFGDVKAIIADVEQERGRILGKIRKMQLTPVILITDSEESRLIYERLRQKGFLSEFPEAIFLKDYTHSNDKLPILIGGSGREHEESHFLSLKLFGHYNTPDIIKVMYDNHDDLTPVPKIIAGSHLYHTSKAGIFSEIHIVNSTVIKDKHYMEKITGKYIHLSLDLDLLKEKYIDAMWMPGQIRFEDLLASILRLVSMNTIIALDIFALAPFNCWDSKSRYYLKEGLWRQIAFMQIGVNGRKERVLSPGEEKDIAPSFDRGVKHYGVLINSILKE